MLRKTCRWMRSEKHTHPGSRFRLVKKTKVPFFRYLIGTNLDGWSSFIIIDDASFNDKQAHWQKRNITLVVEHWAIRTKPFSGKKKTYPITHIIIRFVRFPLLGDCLVQFSKCSYFSQKFKEHCNLRSRLPVFILVWNGSRVVTLDSFPSYRDIGHIS